ADPGGQGARGAARRRAAVGGRRSGAGRRGRGGGGSAAGVLPRAPAEVASMRAIMTAMRATVVAALALAACHGDAATTASSWPEPAKDALTKVTESGPVKATVQLWPAKPTLGDPMWLRLT